MTRKERLFAYLQGLRRRGGGLESLGEDPVDRVLESLQHSTPVELAGLEAIVQRMRPALLVEGQDILDAHTSPGLTEALGRLKPALSATFRIESKRRSQYHGTGFLVGKHLLLTNRHVAQGLFDRIGMATTPPEPNCECWASPSRDVVPPAHCWEVPIVGAKWIHPHWDAALLILGDADELKEIRPLKLMASRPTELEARVNSRRWPSLPR